MKRNVGSKFSVKFLDLILPLKGRLVTIQPDGEEPVRARITTVGEGTAEVTVVPDNTLE